MSAGSESELQKLRTDGKMSEHLFQLAGSGDVERLTAILKGKLMGYNQELNQDLSNLYYGQTVS